MENVWSSIQLGEAQVFRNVIVLPITAADTSTLDYLTLEEALRAGQLRIEEISQSGSVPELRATSSADRPILLLDGEEVLGAKQNRVMNASILLKEGSETIIPVSCTEQGRWSYVSAAFGSSEAILSQKIRTAKMQSVSASLARQAKYSSNQAEVWEGIARLHQKAKSSSSTSAMFEVFRARRDELRAGVNALTILPGQKGLVVIVNGEVAGLDVFSSSSAYEKLHPKLVRSYLLDAILDETNLIAAPEEAEERAMSFLQTITQCETRDFSSLGYGQDRRFKTATAAGSALFHDGKLIHAAFFTVPPAPQTAERDPARWRDNILGV